MLVKSLDVSWDIELNTRREIPYLRPSFYYSPYNPVRYSFWCSWYWRSPIYKTSANDDAIILWFADQVNKSLIHFSANVDENAL